MLIGEVSERSGVPAKTLRYYEQAGLLPVASRTASGYRVFGDEVLERLVFIRSAQSVGLTLGEIRGIVALRENGEVPCEHVFDLLRSRANDIEETIRRLRVLEVELNRLLDRAGRLDPKDCGPGRVCHLIAGS